MANNSSPASPPQAGIESLSQKLCYGLAMAFLQTPLRRFGFRTPAITRFDSAEVYIEDRVADTLAYAQLFGRFTPF